MIGSLTYSTDKEAKITNSVSAYNPPEDVKKLTDACREDYQTAYDLQNRPFTEFNDLSLFQRADLDQKRWNAYRAPQSEDIDEAWRWNGIRPITRNRIISIVAQMTAKIVIPAPFAQNDKDELDMTAAMVMRDLMDYNIRNSNYVEDYIMWITDALVNPAAYLGVGFYEAMQTIKEENEGKISKKEVIDGVLSGFRTNIIPLDEILISNFYQKNLDKQRFVFRRRYIDYDEARALKGEHDNFEYVKPGVRSVFNEADTLFYDIFDDNLDTLCEELTYYNRTEDLEVQYLNGIYVGDKDTEANRIKHRDSEDRPKYNFAVLGYEDISSRFFYYKSAAWKLGDDDELVVRTEQLLADATFIATMMPTITTGVGQLSEAIMIPGKNTAFENENVKITPIQLGNQLSGAFNLLLAKEKSMSESTQDPLMSGIQTSAKTATEAGLLVQNAKIALGRFGNMLTNSLKRLGGLMIDVIVQHQTIAEVSEITGEEKWKTFILTDVKENDLNTTHKIMFKPDMMGQEMNEEEMFNKSNELMDKEGGVDSDMRIFEVNPEAWRKLKYNLVLDVEELLPKVIPMENPQMLNQNQQMPINQKVV